MKYKAGDKVRVRKDLTDDMYGSDLCVTQGMLKYRGKVATVTIVRYFGCGYSLNIDSERWIWNDDMLEKADEKDETQDIIDKLELEFKDNKEKNRKAGHMLNQGVLNEAHKDLLLAQATAYRTVNRILKARIDLLKQDLGALEQEPEKKYQYHLIGGNSEEYINKVLLANSWYLSNNLNASDLQTTFTDEEIKESPYDLTKFEKEEVKQDD